MPSDWIGETKGAAGYRAWCAGDRGSRPLPGVNRVQQMQIPRVGCGLPRPVDSYAPALELDSFEPVGRVLLGGEWILETVEVDGIRISITNDDPIQTRAILDTIRKLPSD